MGRCVDLDERVTAQYYDEECEEWTMKTVTIEDVLDSICDDYTVLPSAQGKPFNLPEIYIADGYDTIEGEDGNVGFGVYVPDENQIYVAGDVEGEIRARALLHEICHWVQAMCGRSFDEDEANEFSDIVYDALPSAQETHEERTETHACDCIDRQAAIDALRYAQHRFTVADEAGGMGTVKWSENVIYFAAAERALTDLPSAQLERKRGKWISTDDGWDGEYFVCSECGCPWTLIQGSPEENGMNFCPNCGADMREVDDE